MQKKRREKNCSENILCIEKKKGETMGEVISRAKEEYLIKNDEKVTFAGRLDPLASGVVLLLKNDARFQKEAFLSLSKVYEFEVIMGIETDSLDVLGEITMIDSKRESVYNNEASALLKKSLHTLLGKRKQIYPLYSSKTVKGKPLFEYARKNILVNRPVRHVHIYDLELISARAVKKEYFLNSVKTSIGSVNGNFRQEKILKLWRSYAGFLPSTVNIYKFRVVCSAGTYVRVLATDIAALLDTVGLADNIRRLQVGEFTKL
jgi:tRNA pseudouridine(55) synthase